MQGPPSDIQHELSHHHRKKPNLLHRSQGEPPTKPQPFISSRVFTTHPELGSDHFQGNCSENPREACHRTWLMASWHMWAVESGGELEVVFGKTRQLCMYVATWCEYGSFSLQYTGQSPSIIQTATLGSREYWVGEGPLAGVRREWSQLRCLHQSLLHLVMAHLSELNKQPRPHKLQVCPHAFVSAFVRNRKAVRSWSEVGETVKVLHLYRSKLTGNYKSALILLPSVIMLVRLE